MRSRPEMQRLLERRGQLITQIKELNDRLAELDLTLSILRGEDGSGLSPVPPTKRRRNVKKTVMDIITETADLGVTADEVVAQAARIGRQMERGSVSSLLSKLKADGVLRYDGERYFPAAKTPPQDPPHPFKVVGGK